MMDEDKCKVLDEQVQPLVNQIYDICEAHKIPLIFAAAVNKKDFFCSEHIDSEWETPVLFFIASQVLGGKMDQLRAMALSKMFKVPDA